MATAPVKQKLIIPGPAGSLEALLETPAKVAHNRIAVVCHPHPLYQGTMHNKVVHALARSMNDLGMAALRFNFRGVGASEGHYANGEGEVEDLQAVANFVQTEWGEQSLWLLGFSFGAVIAARAAMSLDAAQLITVAPAVNLLGAQLQQAPEMPWLIVAGEEDDIVPLATVKAWAKGLQPKPEVIVISGAGHFFHGRLVLLRKLLSDRLS